MKILIVEDEPKTGDYLRQGLREAGFGVELASDGLAGLQLAQQQGRHQAVEQRQPRGQRQAPDHGAGSGTSST